MERMWKGVSFILGSLLVGTLLSGVLLSLPSGLQSNVLAQRDINPQNLQTANDLSTAFRQVANSMRPSVVSINSMQKARVVRGGTRGIPDGILEGLPPEIRDQLFGNGFGDSGSAQPQKSGVGSGVIIRADGYILTNNHVVEGADALEVELSDRRRIEATIVGTDPQTDLAVIKIDAPNLEPAPLGDSDAMQVGDWVLAMGSPFGLDQTVTAGIISAKNRVQGIVGQGEGFEDFLQTDAAINPGNSGGPLVNLRGEVIGINTAIASRSGGYNGIGFTIPTSLAGPIVDSLIESGSVRRGFLGAKLGPIDEQRMQQLGLPNMEGAYIDQVLEGQPAHLGGLQPGDVVVEVNGREIRDLLQLRNIVALTPPNGTLKFKVIRNAEPVMLTIVLGERTNAALARFNPAGELWGADLEPLTEETAQQLGMRSTTGLLVTNVTEDSVASAAGLDAGDVILRANGQPIGSIDQLKQMIAQAEQVGRPLQLVVKRGNSRGLVTIQ
ncbi:Do family serine endopeptidase [Rosistilla oblonga]|uniref:Do family serine endopeptidase n=1 Tax=Rosistilla oblonga TaxID=2527990 RepID=UPI003A986273